MRALSLFSGGGGLDLAAEWAGIDIVGQVEYEPACIKVLERHWPDTPRWEDVRNVSGTDVIARCGGIDLIFGGFPCQPHSVAGKRKASGDERDLWPEYARLIREIKPRWVVGENVPGLLTSENGRFFGAILRDLDALGYDAGWGVWGAADVGAPHQRDRVFIVANRHNTRSGTSRCDTYPHGAKAIKVREEQPQFRAGGCGQHVADAQRQRQPRQGQHGDALHTTQGGYGQTAKFVDGGANEQRRPQPRLGRNPDGRANRLDAPRWPAGRGAVQYTWEPPRVVPAGRKGRTAQIKMLGNMVVPWQALPLFEAIMEVERC